VIEFNEDVTVSVYFHDRDGKVQGVGEFSAKDIAHVGVIIWRGNYYRFGNKVHGEIALQYDEVDELVIDAGDPRITVK
jgi:hypothetical protein